MARRKDQIIVWNSELDKSLKELRSQGNNIECIALYMGFSPDIIMRQLRKLGLNNRLNRGSVPGHLVPSYTPKSKEQIAKERKLRDAWNRREKNAAN